MLDELATALKTWATLQRFFAGGDAAQTLARIGDNHLATAKRILREAPFASDPLGQALLALTHLEGALTALTRAYHAPLRKIGEVLNPPQRLCSKLTLVSLLLALGYTCRGERALADLNIARADEWFARWAHAHRMRLMTERHGMMGFAWDPDNPEAFANPGLREADGNIASSRETLDDIVHALRSYGRSDPVV